MGDRIWHSTFHYRQGAAVADLASPINTGLSLIPHFAFPLLRVSALDQHACACEERDHTHPGSLWVLISLSRSSPQCPVEELFPS